MSDFKYEANIKIKRPDVSFEKCKLLSKSFVFPVRVEFIDVADQKRTDIVYVDYVSNKVYNQEGREIVGDFAKALGKKDPMPGAVSEHMKEAIAGVVSKKQVGLQNYDSKVKEWKISN